MKKAAFKILKLVLCAAHWICSPLLPLFCLLLRFAPKKFDVGMGPMPMINNVYWARALRRKGYSVETYTNKPYAITAEFDRRFDKGWRRIFSFIPALSFLRAAALYRCAYMYLNGGPLRVIPALRLAEPWLFRLAGVKTAVMPYGSDCHTMERTPNKTLVNALCVDYPSFFRKSNGIVRRQVAAWSRGADIVIGAMDSIDYMHFWNRVRHCHFAIDTDAFLPSYPNPLPGRPVKILHAPNHKECKGTKFVFKAIEQLKSEGYDIELIFKQGVPNNEFLEIVREADIVIDQLIVGWYAMFAMEAMSFGKPVICYMRPDLVKTYEDIGCIEAGEIPVISAGPNSLVKVLRELLDSPGRLAEIGRRSREYTVKYHSLDVVGGFFDEINKSVKIKPNEELLS